LTASCTCARYVCAIACGALPCVCVCACVEALAVGMRRGRANMLTIATVHGNNLFDEIYCVCDDPARRNRWIAMFRGMGVAIFDLRD